MIVLQEGVPIMIGTRKKMGSRLLVRQPLVREFLGKCFTLLSNTVLSTSISDFTCGFKCFSREAASDIFKRQRLNDWSFDAEIMFIASKWKYEIREIPVVWADAKGTKVKLLRDIFSSLRGLALIRWNELLKRYE